METIILTLACERFRECCILAMVFPVHLQDSVISLASVLCSHRVQESAHYIHKDVEKGGAYHSSLCCAIFKHRVR